MTTMPTVPMPSAEMTVGRQGHYAGAASRLVAFAADVGALWGLYLLGQTLISWAWRLITGHTYTLTNHRFVAYVVLGVWAFIYFAYQWAVSGKTLGMAIFGVQVVTVEGGPISPQRAVLRTVGLALTSIASIINGTIRSAKACASCSTREPMGFELTGRAGNVTFP